MADDDVDVDDIWAQMQAESRATKKNVSLSSLQRTKKPSAASSTRATDNDQAPTSTDLTTAGLPKFPTSSTRGKKSRDQPSWLSSMMSFGTSKNEKEEELAAIEPIAEAVPTDSPENFIAHLARDINILQDAAANVELAVVILREKSSVTGKFGEKTESRTRKI